jgi:hypothetical protein
MKKNTTTSRLPIHLLLMGSFIAAAFAFQNCGAGNSFDLKELSKLENGQGYGGVIPPDMIGGGAGGVPGTGGGASQGPSLSYFSREICGDGSAEVVVRLAAGKFTLQRQNCQPLVPEVEIAASELVYSALSSEVIVFANRFLTTTGWSDVHTFCKGGIAISGGEGLRADVLLKDINSTSKATILREAVTVQGYLDRSSLYSTILTVSNNLVGIQLPEGQVFKLVNLNQSPYMKYQLVLDKIEGGGSALRNQSFDHVDCYRR